MAEERPTREIRAQRELDGFIDRIARDREPEADTVDLAAAAAALFDAFDAMHIEGLVLKGPALAQLLYSAAERRNYADLDVLVAPRHLTRAREALTGLGYRNASEVLGIDDIGGVVHEEAWLGRPRGATDELLIELHLRLAGAKASPELAWEALAQHRTDIPLGGRRVTVLKQEGLAMHLAIHAAQHGPEYAKGLRELRLGLERWSLDVWREATILARQVDALDVFTAGLRLVPAGTEAACRLHLAPDDRIDAEVRDRRRRPRGSFHLQALSEAQGLSGRVRVLRRALFPSRRWIVWQYPWACTGHRRLVLAYVLHLMRAPAWTFTAWRFQRRTRRLRSEPRS